MCGWSQRYLPVLRFSPASTFADSLLPSAVWSVMLHGRRGCMAGAHDKKKNQPVMHAGLGYTTVGFWVDLSLCRTDSR